MTAKLQDLVSESELKEIQMYVTQRSGEHPITGFEEIRDLTVKQLSGMSLTLMRTEHNLTDNSIMPSCTLPAEAIKILVKRAIAKGYGIN